jgi:hypothetical protein
MNKQEQEPEVLVQVEKLIDDGNLNEALTLLNAFEQKERLNPRTRTFYHLHQCKILFWQGRYKELFKLAE